MKKRIAILVIASLLLSPAARFTYAAQIQAKGLSQAEVEDLIIADADSTCTVSSVVGGDETDAWAAAGIVLVVLLLIAAVAASESSSGS